MLTLIDHPIPAGGNKLYYDGPDGVPGFALRITPAGFKTFILVYRVSGQERRMRIGSPPQWTIARARKEAQRLKRAIDTGEDPQGERVEARDAPNVKELVERYMRNHLPATRPATREEYASLLKIIIAKLGNKKVAAVTHSDTDAIHRGMKSAPYRANKLAAVGSRLFNLAIKWGWIENNPWKGIERNVEHVRERYLTESELGALLSALADHGDKQAANVIRLLVLTGARKSEVLGAKWQDIDFDAATWTKPAATTKTNKLHRVQLSEEAIELLGEIRDGVTSLTFVFPGDGRTGHRANIKKNWAVVCRAANIDGLRIHDLRHAFASFALNSGESLSTVGKLLGHTQNSTTQRYAHVFDSAQRRAAGAVGKIFANAKGRGNKVLSFPQK